MTRKQQVLDVIRNATSNITNAEIEHQLSANRDTRFTWPINVRRETARLEREGLIVADMRWSDNELCWRLAASEMDQAQG
jgi:hypothetical protein